MREKQKEKTRKIKGEIKKKMETREGGRGREMKKKRRRKK